MPLPIARSCSLLFVLALLTLAAPPAFAAETVCDGLDDDGNRLIDEGCDDDGDDYCDNGLVVFGTPPVCPRGGGDCDDDNSGINPAAPEICNGLNDDCTGGTDDGCDDDGDDYCDSNLAVVGTPAVCPQGGGDCDDENSAVNPGQVDVCNGLNDDCAADIDTGCDDDGDDYCDKNLAIVGTPPTCPLGGGDCNDTDHTINPGAVELCDDGTDSDCDGDLDPDADLDGLTDCVDNCPAIANPGQENGDGDGSGDLCDCAPGDPRVFVQAPELNDSRDNQCPGDPGFGLIDEISGLAGFTDPDKKFSFCWTAQEGATQYRRIRADDPQFLGNCADEFTDRLCVYDDTLPPPTRAHYYLVAAVAPNRGSFGADSTGIERSACP